MTTLEFLSENRKTVISFYNSNIKNDCNITLKDFMTELINDFSNIYNIYKTLSKKNLYDNLFKMETKVTGSREIGVTYTKPFSESTYAKMVEYHGRKKTEEFYNM